MKTIQSLCAALWVVICPVLPAADVYDFESLADGSPLAGQDQWTIEPSGGTASVITDAPPAENTTKVARHDLGPVPMAPAVLTRINNATFNYLPFVGNETMAVIQFEATGEYVAVLALGRDVNGDGLLREEDTATGEPGEVGPSFGVFDRNFLVQEADGGTSYTDNFNAGGGDGNSGNDWYRIQLRMDFTANGGDGIGSLYFKNLSQGDTTFHSVSGTRNVPLGLTRLPAAAGPARWNAMRITLLSNGNSVPRIDNIIPNGTTIRWTEVRREDGQLLLAWRGGLGPYLLQQSPDLGAGSWSYPGLLLNVTSTAVPIEHARMFFRVAQPPP
jgi:hypothetical protein